jgi:hypothetical protein
VQLTEVLVNGHDDVDVEREGRAEVVAEAPRLPGALPRAGFIDLLGARRPRDGSSYLPNPNPRCHDPSAHDAHSHVPGMRVPNRTPAGDVSCSKANPLITAADVAATTAVGSWWAVSEANGQVRGVDRILLLPPTDPTNRTNCHLATVEGVFSELRNAGSAVRLTEEP